MVVRSFQLSDYLTVTKLLGDVLSENCYKDTIDAFARQLSLDSSLVLVTEINHEIVGVIIGTIDNNHGYYFRIAVNKNNQRKGIGKLMIQSLRQRFEQRKVNKIFVNIDTHNEPILPLYESLGYLAKDYLSTKHKLRIVNG